MEARSKQSGDATDTASKSQPMESMAEQALASRPASSEDTPNESSPRLNRADIRNLIRQLPRENRVKYFFGLHRYPSRLLPRPSNFVNLRRQLGAAVEKG
jgi:hypothetical protein